MSGVEERKAEDAGFPELGKSELASGLLVFVKQAAAPGTGESTRS